MSNQVDRSTVYISGVHSGPNPSPGIGLARSLRPVFPSFQYIGVDYSSGSAGLHTHYFDHVLTLPDWNEQSLLDHPGRVKEFVGQGAFWISGLDIEINLLAMSDLRSPAILSIGTDAWEFRRKPCTRAAALLGMSIPPWIGTIRDQAAVHSFMRLHDWLAWVKGPHHEAFRCRSLNKVNAAIAALHATWGEGAPLFLQSHVSGTEYSIAFAAYDGTLCGACFIEKTQTIGQGKTWSGAIDDLDASHRAALETFVRRTSWTGGGEIEAIRDPEGTMWLIEINPRFPAWIHGATLAGINLPARLLSAALGRVPGADAEPASGGFTRIIIEIPMTEASKEFDHEVREANQQH